MNDHAISDVNARLCMAAVEFGGVAEVRGGRSHPMIVRWLAAVIPGFKGTDATAWCSAWMVAVAERAHADLGDRPPNATARSWTHVGTSVLLEQARPGDVVVLSRPGGKAWQGHVGVYARHGKRTVTLFGGNQGNRSGFADYPLTRIVTIQRLPSKPIR